MLHASAASAGILVERFSHNSVYKCGIYIVNARSLIIALEDDLVALSKFGKGLGAVGGARVFLFLRFNRLHPNPE